MINVWYMCDNIKIEDGKHIQSHIWHIHNEFTIYVKDAINGSHNYFFVVMRQKFECVTRLCHS